MATTDHRQIPKLNQRQRDHLFQKFTQGSPEECWPWNAYINTRGYPSVSINNFPFKATRVLYYLATGIDPGVLCVLHKCDVRRCCNWNHMFLGTDAENTIDMLTKGRCKAAKITADTAIKIRLSEGSVVSIGRRFEVSEDIVRRIKHGKTWRHLQA